MTAINEAANLVLNQLSHYFKIFPQSNDLKKSRQDENIKQLSICFEYRIFNVVLNLVQIVILL